MNLIMKKMKIIMIIIQERIIFQEVTMMTIINLIIQKIKMLLKIAKNIKIMERIKIKI